MKIAYQQLNFQPQSLALITLANEYFNEYAAQGYRLTLRQIYYVFVSRDSFPDSWRAKETGSKNNERSYKRLGDLLNNARLAGMISWKHMEDGTRNYEKPAAWEDPESILAAVASSYRIDPWLEQPYHIEVWVEKDALVDVIARACEPWRVGYFSCRGYTSQSEMWAAAMRLREYRSKKLLVLHLGDHDPSGIDMTRDIAARMEMFLTHHGITHFQMERLALTYEQVEQYNPPPSPTKITDSRANAYIDEYGDDCWELDALEPSVIVELVQQNIEQRVEEREWSEAMNREEDERSTLQALSDRWEDVSAWINTEATADE